MLNQPRNRARILENTCEMLEMARTGLADAQAPIYVEGAPA